MTISPLVEPLFSLRFFSKSAVKFLILRNANFMQKFLEKCQPSDVIAIILIIGSLWLKFSGTDGTVGLILIGICAYYFGKRFKFPSNIDV